MKNLLLKVFLLFPFFSFSQNEGDITITIFGGGGIQGKKICPKGGKICATIIVPESKSNTSRDNRIADITVFSDNLNLDAIYQGRVKIITIGPENKGCVVEFLD